MIKKWILLLLSAMLLMFAGCTEDRETDAETEFQSGTESESEPEPDDSESESQAPENTDAPVTLPRDNFN